MDMWPYEAKTQKEFLQAAFKYYRNKMGEFTQDSSGNAIIHWLYKLGRDYNILNMDYAEFTLVMTGKHYSYSHWNGTYYWYNRSRRFHRTHRRYYSSYSHYCDPKEYRALKGFTNNGCDKKPKRDKAWREHKGIDRDKSKSGKYFSSWKKNLKYYSARKHRQLERAAIKAERYEKLHRWTYKNAENPWNWD